MVTTFLIAGAICIVCMVGIITLALSYQSDRFYCPNCKRITKHKQCSEPHGTTSSYVKVGYKCSKCHRESVRKLYY